MEFHSHSDTTVNGRISANKLDTSHFIIRYPININVVHSWYGELYNDISNEIPLY